MKWDGIQTALKESGALVFAMDQGQTAVLTQPGPWGTAYKGYCAGLAVEWIALRYAGKDFPYDHETQVCEMPPWQGTRVQTVMDDNWDGSAVTSLRTALAAYGLTFNLGRHTVFERAMTGADLKKAGVAADGCYYVYLAGASDAHAVAMQRVTGRPWRFFDGNYGEFRAGNRAEFEYLVDWYWDLAGYGEDFDQRTRIVGVNPPPYVNARVLKDRTGR